ncbi:hypothetical protein FM102_01550 [Corynebacterium glutamicum]|nr:hypothetical protein FM102_01550 [Corynebacterium glutamicum]
MDFFGGSEVIDFLKNVNYGFSLSGASHSQLRGRALADAIDTHR